MPETASAPSLTVFQSAVMATVERMLRNLSQRVAGPQSEFGSRHQTFAERVLDRRLGTMGLEPWRLTAAPRQPAAQDWVFPRRWAPEPKPAAELVRPDAASPPTTAAAVAPVARRLPTPSLAERAPSLPLPPAPTPPTLTPVATATTARTAPVRPTETPPSVPTPARPASPPTAAAPAPTTVAGLAPPPTVAEPLPAAATPALPVPTELAAQSVAAPTAVPAPAAVTAPATVAAQSDAVAAPAAVAAPTAATPTATFAPRATVAAAATSGSASVIPASPTAPERVFDWLARISAPVAAQDHAAAPATAARPSALGRAFAHLDWSDVQLGRAPESKRLLGSLLETLPTASPRAVAPAAMPMLAPEAPPTAARAAARPVAAPPSQAAAAAAATVAPGAARAPTATPILSPRAAETATPALPTVAESRLAATAPAATAVAPLAAAPAAFSDAAPVGPAAQSLAMLPFYEAALLGAPLAPQLAALRGSAAASVRPASALFGAEPTGGIDPASPVVSRSPGGLASAVEQFATQVGAQAPSAAAGPSGVLGAPREWRQAPGLSPAISSLLTVGQAAARAAAPGQPLVGEAAPTAALPAQAAYARMLGLSLPFLPPVEAPTQTAPAALRASLAAPAPLTQAAAAPSMIRTASAPLATTARALDAETTAAPTVAPWRGAGGLATLAELWSAGVALGSGSAASLSAVAAATTGAPSLLPQWLPLAAQAAEARSTATATATGAASQFAPIWTAPRLPQPGETGASPPSLLPGRQPELARSLPTTALSPWLRSQPGAATTSPTAVETAPPQAARAGFEPIFADSLFPRRDEPRPTPAARPTAASAPSVTTPAAPRPMAAPTAAPLPAALFRSAGGLAALVEQFAAQKTAAAEETLTAGAPVGDFSQRRYAPFVGLPSVSLLGGGQSAAPGTAAVASPLLGWATAPGVSAAVQRWLAPTGAGGTPRREAFGELPFVPAAVAPTAAAPRSTVEASRRSPAPSMTPAPAAERTVGAAPMVSKLGNAPEMAPTAAAAASGGPAAAPWRSVGGLATLAELFAAGVGVGTGAASGAAEQYGIEASLGLLPNWLRPETRAATTGSAASPRFAPIWPEAPLSRPAAEKTGSLPLVAPTAATAASAATAPTGRAATATGAAQLSRPPSFVTGSVAAAAEHFAAGHGLGLSPTAAALATERLPMATAAGAVSEAAAPTGRWVPVSGGMVFVPAERRPEAARASAPTAGGLSAGGLGLRSELLAAGLPTAAATAAAATSGLRKGLSNLTTGDEAQPYGLTPSTTAAGEPPARFGWSSAGGLVYLGRPVAPRVERLSSQAASPEGAAETGGAQSFRLGDLAVLAERFRGRTQQLPAPTAMATTMPFATTAQPEAATSAGEAPGRRSAGGLVPLSYLFGPERAPSEAPARRATAELSRQQAESLLTSFPKVTGQTPIGGASDRPSETTSERSATLFPQAATETAARLSKLLAARPADWQPSATVAAAVKASGISGMPLWQRMPADLTRLLTSVPALPPIEGSDEQAEAGDEPPPSAAFGRRPDLTVVTGGQARPRPTPAQAPAPSTTQFAPPQRAQETALITAALKASGANSTQVEASVRLMEAIRSAGASQLARSDDRLSLGDLTLIAISMGERKVAAASTTVVPGVPHVETALRLENEHQQIPEDDKTVRQKIEHLAKQVRKEMKARKDAQKERGAVDM